MKKSPDKAVIGVDLSQTKVSRCSVGTPQSVDKISDRLMLSHTKITDAGLEHIKGVDQTPKC